MMTTTPGMAVRRSNQQYFEQVGARETLDCGYAYHSSEYAKVAVCNFLGEAALELVEGDAFAAAEAFYRERGLTCFGWVPAASQDPAAIGELLSPHGFERRETVALELRTEPAAAPAPREHVRIIAARAMRRAYTHLSRLRYADAPRSPDAHVAAQLERLNDPQYDAFVAMEGDAPAGTVAVHQVGEIGRVRDLFVTPAQRSGGFGRALLGFALATARRWSLHPICAAAPAGDAAMIGLFGECGFAAGDTIVSFVRPGAGELL